MKSFSMLRPVWISAALLLFFYSGLSLSEPLPIAPKARFSGGAVPGYVVFGPSHEQQTLDLFDLSTKTWSTVYVPLPLVDSAFATVNGKVIIAGGMQLLWFRDLVKIYDINRQEWTSAQLSEPRALMAAATAGSIVAIGGGIVNSNTLAPSSVVDIYDDEHQSWSTANLSEARRSLAAASANGIIAFAGGRTDTSISDTVDLYDVHSGSWRTARLSQARFELRAFGIGSKIFFAGGYFNDQYEISNRIDIFDTETDEWQTATLPFTRAWFSTAVVGHKAFIAGGWSPLNQSSNIVDIYDSELQSWTQARISEARSGLAVAANGNYVIFAGGWTPKSSQPVGIVDYYTISDGIWRTSPDYCPNDPLKDAPGVCGCGVSEDCNNRLIGISINGGESYTNERSVKLAVVYPPGTTEILLSNDGGFANPVSFAPAATLPWTLSNSRSERLPKIVYARFIGGNAPGNYFDDIILDQSLPVLESATAARTLKASALGASKKRTYRVSVRARDRTSGITSMWLSSTGRWMPYRSTTTVSTTARLLSIRVKDGAGNRSRSKTVHLR